MEARAGVVIGSYGMPGVVELNIASIRETCGPVPILVADDCTPCHEGGSRIMELASKWPGVHVWRNQRNYGHARGDVMIFRAGLVWAAEHCLQVLCKFSQRFIITTPGWLRDDAEWLLDRSHALASQPGLHLHMRFAMRTEAVLMDVARCGVIVPKLQDCVTAAEDHVHWACTSSGLSVARWPRIPPDRFHPYDGILWHNTHGIDVYGAGGQAYRELADRLGVDLGPEFSAAGWHVIAAHRPGVEYAHFK